MEENLKKLIIGLIIFLSLADISFAADSFTISVSCTIPAIPGVNAPLIEEETIKTGTGATAPASQEAELQNEIAQQVSQTAQPAIQEEKVVDNGQKSMVIVKTVYDR